MTAEKGNKVYTIDETMKAQYQNDGFDIRDGEGHVIAGGKGKSISNDCYETALKEIEQLHGRIRELEGLQRVSPDMNAADQKKPEPEKKGRSQESR